jgi:hypothetical protein
LRNGRDGGGWAGDGRDGLGGSVGEYALEERGDARGGRGGGR